MNMYDIPTPIDHVIIFGWIIFGTFMAVWLMGKFKRD